MAGENREYLRWVRTLACCAPNAHAPGDRPGRYIGEAHHAGRRGVGQRAHDETAVPLCTGHHHAWHDHRGPFLGWTAAERREWADARIAETQQRWAARAA